MAHLHDDDEQRNERFDVEADFEGGEWIGGEFFHRGKKQKRQQTAEDRLYGIFAEDSGAGGLLLLPTCAVKPSLPAVVTPWWVAALGGTAC